MRSRHSFRAVLGLNLLLVVPALLLWRTDRPARAARPSDDTSLRLAWVRHESPLTPAWPDQPRFTSDAARRPVVAGDVVLLTSAKHDSLTAVDRRTGQLRWRFRADGPVRFAPAVWRDRAFFVSDDGHLYCVRLSDGKLRWRFRGGPSDRLILGNERLISTWPARGGPAVAVEADGTATVYFAAGIWPFMGIFLHALDARHGTVRWTNSGEGSTYIKQPHNTDAFAGIAPQGGLVVAGDRLLVPGGRSIPACFDRHTGQRLYYRLAESSRLGGGPDLTVGDHLYHSGGGLFDLATGKYRGPVGDPVAFAGATLYSASAGQVRAFDLDALPHYEDSSSKKRSRLPGVAWLGRPTASVAMGRTSLLATAPGRLFGATAGSVYALDLPLAPRQTSPAWKAAIDGTPIHLVVEGNTVLVSTREGRVYAFAPGKAPSRNHHPALAAGSLLPSPPVLGGRGVGGEGAGLREEDPLTPNPSPPSTGARGTGIDAGPRIPTARRRRVERLVAAAGVKDGYAVVWGIGDGSLIAELARRGFRLFVFDGDAGRVAALREQLQGADIGGERIAVRTGSPDSVTLPPYLASLMVFQGEEPPSSLDSLFAVLRPFGGVAVFPDTPGTVSRLRRWREGRSADREIQVETRGDFALVRRPGAIPGSADWTHQHADAANTRVSKDRVIKAPLGVLWFGGPGHQGILPRHGHGPVPQVCQGRLLIEGPDRLRAIDIYTGRLLWETMLPGLGKVYNNQAHQPGANARGSNYVSTPQGVFVAYQNACLRLDPATGEIIERFYLPHVGNGAPEWTFLSVVGDYLIGGSDPLAGRTIFGKKKPGASLGASKRLTVLDRKTGAVRFSIDARHGFRHNAVCAGNGLLFAIDRTAGNGRLSQAPGKVIAVDLASGKRLWTHEKEVFGTWLSYSTAHDVLVEAGLMARDTLADEAPGMRAFGGKTGRLLWHRPDYFGPALLLGDRILKGGDARASSGTACDLRTGEPIETADPLTGGAIPWRWERTYGCNTPAASEHLVLFRSGAAGFYDLCNNGGTGNLGGFRSSCTLNLIAAGGVLTAPDFTRSCTCSYQHQTSIGFIHMPEAELWTFNTNRPLRGIVRRVGINLGAPGSRKAENGTLWLEYPPSGGPSPRLAVRTKPPKPEIFRMHASQVSGPATGWLGASGMRGLDRLVLTLGADRAGPRRYTVRMVFLEPDALAPGKRLFDVSLQGKPVASRLDIVGEAGGSRRAIVREFRNILINRDLTITLSPCADAEVAQTLLCGVEVVAEGW